MYRLLRRPFSAQPFDGEGSFRYGGRWSRPGTRLVYTAEHLSLAMVEYLVHIDPDHPPEDLVMAVADVPEEVSRRRVDVSELPEDWREYPAPESLAEIGDHFIRKGEAAVLMVPSALAPTEWNWLINPLHPESGRIRVFPTEHFAFDTRLLKPRG